MPLLAVLHVQSDTLDDGLHPGPHASQVACDLRWDARVEGDLDASLVITAEAAVVVGVARGGAVRDEEEIEDRALFRCRRHCRCRG